MVVYSAAYEYESVATFSCEEGYKLCTLCDKTRTCHHTAEWTGTQPVCNSEYNYVTFWTMSFND